jgi:Cys-rich protein (TIGR01571 family)
MKQDDFGQDETWTHGLCDCWQVFFKPLFWMAWCCGPLVTGQLMTRMSLTWSGTTDKLHAGAKTFSIVAIIFLVYLFTQCIGLPYVSLAFFVYMIIVLTRTRGAIRRHFRIPARMCGCGDGSLEDFCCGLWCGCCSTIQMARHTHNEEKYPYEPCTASGVPSYAPAIMERDDETIQVV